MDSHHSSSDIPHSGPWNRIRDAYRDRPRLLIAGGTAALVLLVGIPFAAVQLNSSPSAADTSSSEEGGRRIVPVETLTVQPVDGYDIARTYTGEIVAVRDSDVGFERSGKLVDILVQEGDRIEAGDPIARLDIQNLQTQKRQLEAQRAQAEARLLELERGPRQEDIAAARAEVRDLENQLQLQEIQRSRREYLYQEGAISREQLDEFAYGEDVLEARLDRAQSRLEELLNGTRPEQIAAQRAVVQQLDANIDDIDVTIAKSTVNAPFEGIVANRQADEGAVITAGQPVISLVEDIAPEARIGLPSQQAEALEVGSTRTLQLGGDSYEATVTSILPEVDPNTRTQTVVLLLERSAIPRVSPGQTVRLELLEPISSEGYWLPTDAITKGIRGLWICYGLTRPEDSTETTEDGYVVQQQAVEIMHEEGDRVLVRGTLQPGDRIIASGIHRLVPGQPVRPVDVPSQQ